ncbi:hypothetical protein [Candidatus Parabeggiatoa sp. HSG14]|uniref:hypothetical protein n=1 Tax=Candidatus Parabeggiatoa sp. HSG14 TaxID=3055593 RepID=UPI0025A8C127|nr:hypothetical protein [Thiotrichales bacterium HSG14]
METRLQELWRKEPRNNEEWDELYRLIVSTIKHGKKCSVLNILPESIDTHIQNYIVDIALKRIGHSKLYHDAALKIFFCNYLKDILKKSDTQPWINVQYLGQENVEGDEILSPLKKVTPDQSVLSLLQEVRLSIEQVKKSAQQFFQKNEEWVYLYLAYNACLEKGEPLLKLSLVELSKFYQIPNYHRKARQLGITRKKDQFEEGYEKTLLGAWFVSLGLFPKKENITEIEIALKILCNEALLLVDEKQNS